VKSALYAIAEMIENLNSFDGNGGVGSGMALGDYEIIELNKLLQTLEEIERFYDCIGGIIGLVLRFPTFTIRLAWNKWGIDGLKLTHLSFCFFFNILTIEQKAVILRLTLVTYVVVKLWNGTILLLSWFNSFSSPILLEHTLGLWDGQKGNKSSVLFSLFMFL